MSISGDDPHPELGRIELPDDAWVPAPIRWRHVRMRDVLVIGDQLWSVTEAGEWKGRTSVAGVCGPMTHRAEVDPDAVAQVLVPAIEREAFVAAREGLGATLSDRTV